MGRVLQLLWIVGINLSSVGRATEVYGDGTAAPVPSNPAAAFSCSGDPSGHVRLGTHVPTHVPAQHAHTHSDAHAHQYAHANSHADSVACTIQMRIRMSNLFCRVNPGDMHQVSGLYGTSTHHLLSGHSPDPLLLLMVTGFYR